MRKRIQWFTAGLLGMTSLLETANAQSFTAGKGDLLLGFRKSSGGSYELVVNMGSVTNLLNLTPGASVAVGNYTSAQLSAAFSTYNNLQWSVGGAFAGSSAWAGFPAATLWTTVARASTSIQSTAPPRLPSSAQQATRNRVTGVGTGANSISAGLGATNSNNNSVLVREPISDPNALTAFIGDPANTDPPPVGDYQGTWYNVETVTPGSFTAVERADLYQSSPDGMTDPTTQQTTGNAYYVGYFEFNPNGTMTFTRASLSAPAPTVTIQRVGNVSTISFPTTVGFTYRLYYTDSTGLTSPVSSWATSGTSIVGDGAVHSFTDTTTVSDRFYSVGVQ